MSSSLEAQEQKITKEQKNIYGTQKEHLEGTLRSTEMSFVKRFNNNNSRVMFDKHLE